MREKELSTRVIFVRHGQTNFPIDRIYCDEREDPALNEDGKAQAKGAADLLKNMEIGAVYASPALRTRMTAGAIAKHHGLGIEYNDALRERRFGIWEGLYFHEIEQNFTDEFQQWKQDQAGFAPSGGESAYDLYDRAALVLDRIVADNRGNTVVVVSHVGPIRVLLAESIGMPVQSFRSLRIDPASLSCVDYGSKQNNLLLLNYVEQSRLLGL